jgi:hypothetical protein
MLFETNRDKGRAGMAMAIAYFGANGYTVNVPLNDTQWYDLVIEKDGVFKTVQCKATGSADNTISLRSMGGTKGSAYDNVLNHPVDYLFCLDGEMHMYVIPVVDMKEFGCNKQITLRTKKSANGQGFQTYQYMVSL